ncbi:glycine betaine ABC transporter substrate-binding protein [Natronosporangium hydrolyticum]|uniref:Glycine betaine ABC transporter substrate-binding protein n=1 Tax=Natronosporangium hydrolyticum TaxID=2811111 RepID=A0A895YM29_9ACTN|nr:glycine betaine ABC transporter substrate-binding protein [Natronosporangium hydrolyticum]QSB15746.1 glycine betaine ABC transporter substrate-binding protein [Natronosporangium hydrolyticum]
MRRYRKASALMAGAAATALLVAACGNGDDNGNGDDTGANGNGERVCDEPADSNSITIGAFNGWEEGIAATYLWKAAFEAEGYDVTVEFADVGPLYLGMAQCAYDVAFDAWLPATHEDYWDEHGDQMEDLGVWFDEAPLTIAVNEDAPIQSLDELADAADQFDNRIVGIEPGAGLTRITQDEVIPTYGLEGMEFIESSTAAMLAELQGAVDRGDNVVVTLWEPHWAYDAFPIRNLEDPENALGDPEQIHAFARADFTADFAEAAEWVGNWSMTADDLYSLENIMFNENEAATEDEYEASTQQWLDENPDFLPNMTN